MSKNGKTLKNSSKSSKTSRLKLLLEELQVGNTVDLIQIREAAVELKHLEEQIDLKTTDTITVVQSPEPQDHDRSIQMLGEIFMVLQSLVIEMRHKGALQYLQGDIADLLMEARDHLLIHHYEAAKLGKLDALKLRPVTFQKPEATTTDEPAGPPY